MAIDIDPEYSDWLWAKNTRFENVTKAAVIISAENNVYTQIGFENAVATATPVFARFRESGKTLGANGTYEVRAFNHGLILKAPGEMGETGTRWDVTPLKAMPAPLAPAIRPLPPTSQWVNIRTLGVKGDNKTDDTAALQHAIDTTKVLYIPSGRYIVHDTIRLKPDTVLIGLHPSITQFDLPDNTPGFAGVGAPKALLETPKGGDNIVSGIGLFTGGINPRAVEALWQSGANSLMDDVRFLGGHGTNNADGTRWDPYNDTHSADRDIHKRWDGQYPSLWITNGGGGTFSNLWTVDTYAQSGVTVSDTKTPGHIYEVSSEHHVRNEFQFRHAENWEVYAPQTEEEAGESQEALSLEIMDSRNITIANWHAYRVTRNVRPVDTAARIINSSGIHFRNVHVNAESGLATCDSQWLRHLSAGPANSPPRMPSATSPIMSISANGNSPCWIIRRRSTAPAPRDMGSKVEKLEDGFYAISGARGGRARQALLCRQASAAHLWLVAGRRPIHRARQSDRSGEPGVRQIRQSAGAVVVGGGRHALQLPARLAGHRDDGDRAHARRGHTPTPQRCCRAIIGTMASSRTSSIPRLTAIRPCMRCSPAIWRRPRRANMSRRMAACSCPLPRTFQQGPPDNVGWRFSDNLDTYGFVTAKPGSRVLVSNESEARTYSGLVNANGTVTDLKLFAAARRRKRGGGGQWQCLSRQRPGLRP